MCALGTVLWSGPSFAGDDETFRFLDQVKQASSLAALERPDQLERIFKIALQEAPDSIRDAADACSSPKSVHQLLIHKVSSDQPPRPPVGGLPEREHFYVDYAATPNCHQEGVDQEFRLRVAIDRNPYITIADIESKFGKAKVIYGLLENTITFNVSSNSPFHTTAISFSLYQDWGDKPGCVKAITIKY